MHATLDAPPDPARDILHNETSSPGEEIRTTDTFEPLVRDSAALRPALPQIEIVAPRDSTVLIQGETGTGKGLRARAIHDLSRRKSRTFVKVDCPAIPAGVRQSRTSRPERGA